LHDYECIIIPQDDLFNHAVLLKCPFQVFLGDSPLQVSNPDLSREVLRPSTESAAIVSPSILSLQRCFNLDLDASPNVSLMEVLDSLGS